MPSLTNELADAAAQSETVRQSDIPFYRRVLAPIALLTTTPPLALTFWIVVSRYEGSATKFAAAWSWSRYWSELPRPSLWAATLIAGWSIFQWALLCWLPGPDHEGPVTKAGVRPIYRKNGILAWVVTHALLIAGFATGVLSRTAIIDHYGEMVATLTVFAYGLCAFLYFKAIYVPNSRDRVRTGAVFFDYFQGIELHPTIFGTSCKQLFNCRISMMGWSAIVVSCCAYQLETTGTLTPALGVSSLILVLYLFKFFAWETGYFASLDIMHDRFGYYICWGVLAWVPAVYPIAQLHLTANRTEVSLPIALLCGAVGIAAILVNYAADAQRQRVRETGGQCKIWGSPPSVITAKYRGLDGVERQNLLLASGYWGLARHFHYIPEITLALAWTLPAGLGAPAPYVYVAFLTILLFDRSGRDDKRCAQKYGDAWDTYRKRVPYKIVPGIY